MVKYTATELQMCKRLIGEINRLKGEKKLLRKKLFESRDETKEIIKLLQESMRENIKTIRTTGELLEEIEDDGEMSSIELKKKLAEIKEAQNLGGFTKNTFNDFVMKRRGDIQDIFKIEGNKVIIKNKLKIKSTDNDITEGLIRFLVSKILIPFYEPETNINVDLGVIEADEFIRESYPKSLIPKGKRSYEDVLVINRNNGDTLLIDTKWSDKSGTGNVISWAKAVERRDDTLWYFVMKHHKVGDLELIKEVNIFNTREIDFSKITLFGTDQYLLYQIRETPTKITRGSNPAILLNHYLFNILPLLSNGDKDSNFNEINISQRNKIELFNEVERTTNILGLPLTRPETLHKNIINGAEKQLMELYISFVDSSFGLIERYKLRKEDVINDIQLFIE